MGIKKDRNISEEDKKNIIRRTAQVVVSIVIIAVLLFFSSGNIFWIYAWIYMAVSLLVILVNLLTFPSELISERGRKKENVEKWDEIITRFLMIPWMVMYIVSGLDNRYGWTFEYDTWIHIAGLCVYLAGNAWVNRAMVANAFFSTAVRIQFDRGHTVAKGGPYRYMRHPGYLGMIVYIMASPVVLGSLWAIIPAIAASVLFIIRTEFEDKTLQEKLPGYREYSEQVKYKLMPGIW